MPRRSEHWMAETRERIEAAAVELIARRGFHSFTMRDLLLEAWVSVGCFYLHFEDKDDVLRSASEWHDGGGHGTRLRRVPAEGPAPSRLQQLMELEVRDRARPWARESCRLEVLAWSELLSERDLVPAYEKDLPELVASLHQLIREGQRAGEIDRGVFAPAAAMAVAGLITMLPLMRALGFRFTPARMGAVLERMVRSLEAG